MTYYNKLKLSATTELLKIPLSKSKEIKFSTQIQSQLTLLIPTRISDSQDCVCPLIFQANMKCSNLSKCSCIEETDFTPSMIEICNTEQLQLNISFRGLNSETNNSKLFFYHDVCCIQSRSCTEDLYRAYIKSFQIFQGKCCCSILCIE